MQATTMLLGTRTFTREADQVWSDTTLWTHTRHGVKYTLVEVAGTWGWHVIFPDGHVLRCASDGSDTASSALVALTYARTAVLAYRKGTA